MNKKKLGSIGPPLTKETGQYQVSIEKKPDSTGPLLIIRNQAVPGLH